MVLLSSGLSCRHYRPIWNIRGRLLPPSGLGSHAQTRASYAANHAGEDLEFSHGSQFHCGGADERRAWL
jgi:hypothetical protein